MSKIPSHFINFYSSSYFPLNSSTEFHTMNVSSIGVMACIDYTDPIYLWLFLKNSPGLRLGCKLNFCQISSLPGGMLIPA